MTRNPPVLPKSAMAIVGTTDKVAAHGTAHDIAMAKSHKKRHDCFTLQTYFGHGVVKQERNTCKITGFFHEIESECDTEHKGCHHQCEIENIGKHIADQ